MCFRPGAERRKPSLGSDMHGPGPESDTESIADYADGNDAGSDASRVVEQQPVGQTVFGFHFLEERRDLY